MKIMHKAATAVLTITVSLGLVACGSTDAPQSASPQSGTSIPEVERDGDFNFPATTGGYGEDTEISAGEGDAPTDKVYVKTLVQGDGAEVQLTDTVYVNYELALWDGTKVESSFETGKPIAFALNRVIPGWTYGLATQHVGDRVELVVPATWAYGDKDSASIPANSTLIFVVDLLDSTSNVSIDEESLKNATATGNELPAGISVEGAPAVEPTLSFTEGSAAPTEDASIDIYTGIGETIEDGDIVLYRGLGAPFGDASQIQSTWSDTTNKYTADAADLKVVGKTVGTRFLYIAGASAAAQQSAQSGAQSDSTQTITPKVFVLDVIGVMKAHR